MPPKPLWQHGIDWLKEVNGGATHPLDRERALKLARGMRMVGEHPPYREVSAYVGQLWDRNPNAASMVRTTWRSVYRARTSIGRGSRIHTTPLYQPDRLIDRQGLRPVTEVRLAQVAHEALQALLTAAEDGDRPGYAVRERELNAALTAVRHLRFLRYGRPTLGYDERDDDPARRPRWW
jgi:hypothetical protein